MVSIPKDGCSYEPCHDVINKPISCTPLVLQGLASPWLDLHVHSS
jgi:hypothetical protein